MVIIGLSTNRDQKNAIDCMPGDYILSVLRAGAFPLILPMIPPEQPNFQELMDEALGVVDGLVFTGGPDLDPAYYGEEILPGCHTPVPDRDKADLTLMEKALKARKPFLGICRGIQVLNVLMGGSLYQDIPSQLRLPIVHAKTGISEAHKAILWKDSLVYSLMRDETIPVNSRHHQAVKGIAPGLKATACSEDGLVEALEFLDGRPALAVQWHPENLAGDNPQHQALFDWLVREARKRR
jgi:putative glutamine amidotransferase